MATRTHRYGPWVASALSALLAAGVPFGPWVGRGLAQPADSTGGTTSGGAAESGSSEAGEVNAEGSGSEAADADTSGSTSTHHGDEEDENKGPDIGPQLGLSILGGATLGLGILFLVESGHSSDDADRAQRQGQDPATVQTLRDRSDRENVLGIVMTSLAVAMIGAATYLWITAGSDESESAETAGIQVLPTLSADGGGLLLDARF